MLPAVTSATASLAPHPILDSYYADEPEKRRFLSRVFERAACDYDRVERFMALGTGRWYRRQALSRAGLEPGMRVLDVAVGTGLVAREAIRIVGGSQLVTGVDPSPAMIRRAVDSLGISATLGVGEKLPFASGAFDFLSLGYALRHLGDVNSAFSEFARVLAPGGRLCILEIAKPVSLLHRRLMRGYMRYIVPAIARLAATHERVGADSHCLWQYYWDTIDACLPPDRVCRCLEECGFSEVRANMELGMFCEFTAVLL